MRIFGLFPLSKDAKVAFRRLSAGFVVVGSVWILMGCQSYIPKKAMEEMGAYSTAICKCAEKDPADAKPCIQALQKPSFEMYPKTMLGNPKYKLESIHTYDEIEGMGRNCAMKVGVIPGSP